MVNLHRAGIQGNKKQVAKQSKEFASASVESRSSLDDVFDIVISSMPADLQEQRIFFHGGVDVKKMANGKYIWNDQDYWSAVGTLTILAIVLSMVGIYFSWALLAALAVVAGAAGYTASSAYSGSRITIENITKPGTLIRVVKGPTNAKYKPGGPGLPSPPEVTRLQMWTKRVNSVLAPAPGHHRSGPNGGWKNMTFSEIYKERDLDDDTVIAEVTRLTSAWAETSEREWSLADRLLQAHAQQVGGLD